MTEQGIENGIYNVIEVHISEIRPGDTILHTDGVIRTVCPSNITKYGFMGMNLFGDSYRLGTIKVKLIPIRK